jgi:hypothetical protein
MKPAKRGSGVGKNDVEVVLERNIRQRRMERSKTYGSFEEFALQMSEIFLMG